MGNEKTGMMSNPEFYGYDWSIKDFVTCDKCSKQKDMSGMKVTESGDIICKNKCKQRIKHDK